MFKMAQGFDLTPKPEASTAAQISDAESDSAGLSPLNGVTSDDSLPSTPGLVPVPDVHVLVGTFNLATRIPNPTINDIPNLLPWLSPPPSTSGTPTPDLVVVGFQELLSQSRAAWLPTRECSHGLAKLAVKHDQGRLKCLDNWVQLIQDALQAIYGGNGTVDDNSDAKGQNENVTRVGHTNNTSRSNGDSVSSEENNDTTQSLRRNYREGDSSNAREIRYEPYCISRMVALGLLVFIRVDRLSHVKVRGVWEASMGTGLIGTYGNKGVEGIGLDLDILDTHFYSRSISICFANSHLGPHEGFWYYNWRNEEVRHLFETLLFTSTAAPYNVRSVHDFSATFFFGDMNYRLAGAGVKPKEVRKAFRDGVIKRIDEGAVKDLLEMDELSLIRERQRFEPLAGFLEPPITFLPSYKFNVGINAKLGSTSAADRYSKTRMPAYCDRILFRATDLSQPRPFNALVTHTRSQMITEDNWKAARAYTTNCIQWLYYHCASDVVWSDHKPVAALFSLKLDRLSTERHASRALKPEEEDKLMEWVTKERRKRFKNALYGSWVFRLIAVVFVGCLVWWIPNMADWKRLWATYMPNRLIDELSLGKR
ncbi:uncharacterized protein SPPG_06151 [Spizellomyces punctatus DAOM BR117]|uniref:Inositol polyphosphate-related phosphatase domain-containing protein n=1 Tax=Spizellomyces punctatus (strain DAOM BR117) TaxID=645134 RepID=A0A0L0HB55_SPIPD|nr:uncharacterized protein SPPG_06151 [Spizellomyces punctatus DAOM BR117]KNC98447.1 hypothetical protein SPPG_06151 [Spizellomyces punctatus DAOM BR117]|eukprot:XP_016606487.1 hypothetical protein SPPG_06151 [Spizellomyces punctatus DAOM BR117]